MADATSTVIIDVTLNQADALQRAKELSNRIVDLKDNQDKLRASGQQLGIKYRENANEIRLLERETQAYIKLARQEEGSINSLRAQISLLNNQYNAMSKAERESTVAGQALQKQLAALTKEERAATQAAGNFKSNVGNYAESIRQAYQNLLPFGSEVGRVSQSINSLSGAFKSASGSLGSLSAGMLALPLAAIGVGIAGVITYLKDLDTVTDSVSQAMGGFKAAINEIGRSIFNLKFGSIKDLTNSISTFSQASTIVERQQDLEDKMLAQSVKSADAQAKVAELRVQAMNKALDPTQREKLLKQAEEIDARDLLARKKNVDEQIKIAQQSISLTGNLTRKQVADLKKRGVEAAIELQNELVSQGKVTDEQTKALADAYKARTAIESEYTQRKEKRENLSERISLQAQAAEEKRQAELLKLAEDRAKSELYSAQSILSVRQKELSDIELDINKRIELYKKYNQSTVQLEVERQARLKAAVDKFQKEDRSIITNAARANTISGIKNGTRTFGTGSIDQQIRGANLVFDLAEIDRQIAEAKEKTYKGNQDLEEIIQGFNERKKQLNADYDAAESIDASARQSEKINREREFYKAQIQQEQELRDARISLNNEVLNSSQGLFNTIANLAGEQSDIGKAAFLVGKGLAIAQIILNAEVQKSNIGIAATAQIAAASQASLFSFGLSLLAIPAILANAAAQTAAVTANEIGSIATIAATTVGSLVSGKGFADGGYISGPGTGTSDSIPARLSNGESVMTAKATKMFYPILSAMNVAGGGKAFASGGIAGSYVPDISQGINSRNAVAEAISGTMRGIRNVVYVESIVDSIDKQTVLVENANW